MRSVIANHRYIFIVIFFASITVFGGYVYSQIINTKPIDNKDIFYQLLGGNRDWPLEIENQTNDFAEGIYGSGAVVDWVAKKEDGQWKIIYKLVSTEATCSALLAENPPSYFNTVKRCNSLLQN